MSSLGEKIKSVFTGHHDGDDDTHHHDAASSKNTAPAAVHDNSHAKNATDRRDSAVGIVASPTTTTGGQQQQQHRDPEVEAKKATSAAGNYPYWGDLATKDGHEQGRSGGDAARAADDSSKRAAGAYGLMKSDSDSEYSQQQQPQQPHTRAAADNASTKPLVDCTQTPADTMPANDKDDDIYGASTRYLPLTTSTSTSNGGSNAELAGDTLRTGPGRLDDQYTEAMSSQRYEPHNADKGHKHGAFSAGASAAGLAGAAGSLASRLEREEQPSRESSDVPERGAAGGAPPANRGSTTNTVGFSSAGGYVPHSQYSRGDKTTAVEQPEGPPGGAGVYNTVVGAGSPEHDNNNTRSLTSRNATTVVGPRHGDASAVDRHAAETGDAGAPRSADERDRRGLAAAAGVGAGAGLLAARHQHGKHHDAEEKKDPAAAAATTNKVEETTTQQHGKQPAAQQSQDSKLAAQKAWHNQEPSHSDPPSSSAVARSEDVAGGTGANDTTTTHNHSRYGAAAGGAALGAGGLAAYYGQGKEHEQSPRSDESEKVAERAMRAGSGGGAGGPQPPSSGARGMEQVTRGDSHGSARAFPLTSSSGLSSGTFASGAHSSDCSKIVHKCHQCGADNDISGYFESFSQLHHS